jgi:hypothetical protein
MKHNYLILFIFVFLFLGNKISAQQARIEGFIFTDQNQNCLFDNNLDLPQVGTVVSAFNQNSGSTFYANTDTNGFYTINNLPAGDYIIAPHLPYDGLYYNFTCTTPSVVRTLAAQQTDTVSFGLTSRAISPLVRADISAHHLVQCDTGKIMISCDNIGTAIAFGVQMEVELDPYLSFLSSETFGLGTTTVIPVGNNKFVVEIDSLSRPIGNFARQLIIFKVLVSCNADIGQTHLSRLRLITNDSLAVQPNYANAILQVEKDSCISADSLQFRIINPTIPTTQPYIVTQDNIMLRQGQPTLQSGATETVTVASVANATYRLETKQPAGIPAILGDSIAWAIAPSCTANDKLSSFATWYYTGNATPFVDADARNNTAVFAPNSLTASPIGYDSLHFINQGTPLEYNIQIANPTGAPVSNVGVLWQLDTMLDIKTIEPYAATHPYTWFLSGNDSFYFLFDNLTLPASATNLDATASLSFRIRPKSNLPEGTVIRNSAILQLGSANIVSNSVFHTISGNNSFIRVLSFEHLQLPKTTIKLFPNPMRDRATLQFSSEKPIHAAQLKVFNSVGQIVFLASSTHNNFEIERQNLPSGCYVFQIFGSDGALLGLGKLILE